MPTKSNKPRIRKVTFFDRIRVLAEAVAKRPKSPEEKAEAEQVIELMKKAA